MVRKRLFWVIKKAAAALVILAVALFVALQTSVVQTYMAERLLSSLNAGISGKVDVGRIYVRPMNNVLLQDVTITDDDRRSPAVSDTLFHTDKIVLQYSLKGLFSKEGPNVSRVSVTGGGLNLVLEDDEVPVDGKYYNTNLTRIFGLAKDPDKAEKDVSVSSEKSSGKRLFKLKSVKINDFAFNMYDLTADIAAQEAKGGINWYDMNISDICFHIEDMEMVDGIMYGKMKKGSFRERSGFNCRDISGNVRVGGGLTSIDGLRIADDYSDIRIANYSMMYESTASFSDYIDKVRMSVSFTDTCRMNMRTIGFFAPSLEGLDLDVAVCGVAEGTVRELLVPMLSVGLEDYGVSFDFSGGISGLPYVETSVFNAALRKFVFSKKAALGLAGLFSGGKQVGFLDGFPYEGQLVFDGDISGGISDFDVNGGLVSEKGNAGFTVNVSGLQGEDGEPLRISGELATDRVDVGAFAGTGLLGELTLQAAFTADIIPGGDVSARVSSHDISRFVVNGYPYSGLMAELALEQGLLDVRAVCDDPSLAFMLEGMAELNGRSGRGNAYRLQAEVVRADLNAMNIDMRGKSAVSFKIDSQLYDEGGEDVYGEVLLEDLVLENASGTEEIGDIRLSAVNNPADYKVSLDSDFLSAEFEGTASLVQFLKDLQALSTGEAADLLCVGNAMPWSGNRYSFNLTTGNTMGVCSFVSPGLYVAERSMVSIDINDSGDFDADVVSQRIAFGENYIKDLVFKASNPDSTIDCAVKSSEIRAASVFFDNPRLSLALLDNSVYARLSYSDPGVDSVNSGRLDLMADFSLDTLSGKLMTDIKVGNSVFFINGARWGVSPARVFVSDGRLGIDSLVISNGVQNILLNTGSGTSDTLNVFLDRFDISALNPLLGEGYDLKGAVTGYASFPDIFNEPGLLMDIHADSVSIAGEDAGDIEIMSRWDEPNGRFNIYLRNYLDGATTLNTTGFFRPEDKYVSVNMILDGFSAAYLSPALKSVLSGISGKLSGRLSLAGAADELSLRSRNLMLSDLAATVAYTNVTYNFNGSLSMDESGIYADNILVEDRFGHRGVLGGTIGHRYFKDFDFALELKFNGLECINVSRENAGDFYGNAFAAGILRLNGPLDALHLQADAATMPDTRFHVPVSSVADAGGTDILTFRDYSEKAEQDPYDAMLSRMYGKTSRSADISIGLHLNVTPEASVFVELDETGGSMLAGRGSGMLDIAVGQGGGQFDIRGDYTVEEGSFRFSVGGIVSRDFTIDEGSRIAFNGDIMDSDLNINAIYTTKASIATLIADTSSVSSRRTVNCMIGISGKLSNPNLQFDIDIPDIDPMVRSRVESALSTEDKVQKQFLSLLISNSFIPDEQSSIVNNSSMLFSNVSEILSGQLTSILQKLEIPLDLGVNYQQTNSGTDIFDVAVSTQLFNNRVIVNGNIGNRQNAVTGNNGVAGDIDIEIKLDRKGVLRLNLFSHSADQYSSYLDQSQRSGVGITYQQEFSTFKELWRKMFWSRKRKREAEEAEMRAMIERSENEKDEIVIEVR